MQFISDNASGVCPEIMAALAAVNEGAMVSYGNDAVTRRMERLFDDTFETRTTVFPVATGTAANALALSVMCPPWGAVYCHEDAHIEVDECGAPEFFTGGAKLVPLSGPNGKLSPDGLDAAVLRLQKGDPHQVQARAVSITQASEAGTVYTPDEVGAISEVVKKHGLAFHMDGSRFANAIAALGCAPADVTWRAGVDVLSFGATKNGALAAEAVVFFREELVRDFEFRRKRGGHLFSKMRFISAQFEAYLKNGLWLKNAAHANAMARRLADGLTAIPDVTLQYPLEANEVFIRLPQRVKDNLRAAGYRLYGEENPVVRLVTAFNTRREEVDAYVAAARGG